MFGFGSTCLTVMWHVMWQQGPVVVLAARPVTVSRQRQCCSHAADGRGSAWHRLPCAGSHRAPPVGKGGSRGTGGRRSDGWLCTTGCDDAGSSAATADR